MPNMLEGQWNNKHRDIIVDNISKSINVSI